jgi:hypothetical protein
MATRAHPTGRIFLSIMSAFLAIISYPLPSHSKSAGEVLSDYNRLPEKDREAKILEGAKREAKVVYYGTTAVDHVQRVFAEFKKKYPFMEVADYPAVQSTFLTKLPRKRVRNDTRWMSLISSPAKFTVSPKQD